MSEPARSGTCMSAMRTRAGEARVDVDHPRAARRASITHWKPTGWHSAMFDP